MSDVAVVIMRLALGATFLMAGWIKIGEGPRFVTTVRKYGMLPEFVIRPFALTLPWFELFTGIALLAGIFVVPASIIITVLSVCFLLASLSAILRGLSIECDCFGLLYREEVGWSTVVRDGVLVLFGVTTLALYDGGYGILEWIRDIDEPRHILLLLVTGVVTSVAAVLAIQATGLPLKSGEADR